MKVYLSGSSLEELQARVSDDYGPQARILSAELVTVGGIGGFLARRHYEVTVDVPAEIMGDSAHTAIVDSFDVRPRTGLAALLADAEYQETDYHNADSLEGVSTQSAEFDELVNELVKSTRGPSGRRRKAPAEAQRLTAKECPSLATKPGDLSVVVGLGEDSVSVARSMARHCFPNLDDPPGVYAAGMGHGAKIPRMADRSAATAARAVGVERRYPVFVAFGLGDGPEVRDGAARLALLGADHVWVAVDARRKPADTALWVGQVARAVVIHALAVEGAAWTASPETVDELGIPIGWVDGEQLSTVDR